MEPLDPTLVAGVRAMYPQIMAEEIVSIQPMTAPTGLKYKMVRWYHKLFQKRYWKRFWYLVSKCHHGNHTMRHSCWGHQDFCEGCFTHDPKSKTSYGKIFNLLFGGVTWRYVK